MGDLAAAASRARRPLTVLGAGLVAYGLLRVLPATGPWLESHAPFAILVVGVVYGTVTALGAMALILTYRANRFVNFAYGAMGSVVGVLAIGAHRQHGVPFLVLIPAAVVLGALLGVVVERVVLRRFARASRLVITVASIGLAQLLGGIELLGSQAMGFVSLSGAFEVPIGLQIDLGVKTLGGDELLIVAIAPIVLAGLAWFLLGTRHGIAARAAAEDEERALLLGIPVRQTTMYVWAIVGALAALTFVLRAPFTGIAPGVAATGPTFLLPPLAAAVVARMESLPVALGAGIGLGILEQLVRWNAPTQPSLTDAVVFLVIVGALLVQRRRPGRLGDVDRSSWSAIGAVRPLPAAIRSLPELRWGRRVLIAGVAAAALVVPAGWSAGAQLDAAFAVVWGVLAVSLVVLTGWSGHISLGQVGLAGVGGLVAGNLVASHNLDLLLVAIIAAAAGALVAVVVGLPALRIGGLMLAVTTLAFALALDSYVLNVNNFPGLVPSNVPRPMLFERFDLEDQYAMYVVCVVLLGTWALLADGLRRSRTGRALMAMRDNRRSATAAGLAPVRVTLTGFAMAGAIAATAGVAHVLLLHSLSPGSYPVGDNLVLFSTAVIGGLGSISGAVVGVLLFRFLQSLTFLGDLRLVLTGVGLLGVLYALPGGLGQVIFAVRDRLAAAAAHRHGIELDLAPRPAGIDGDGDVDVEVEVEVAEPVLRRSVSSDHDDGGDAVLEVEGLEVAYGSLKVLFGVDVVVRRGEVLALLGTNGAGKSTLLRSVCGLLPPVAGTVRVDGEDVTSFEADALARRGVALMPGGRGVFGSLTVDENLRLAGWMLDDRPAERDAAREEAVERFPVLRERGSQAAGSLSGGEQQMLALAMSLMTRPAILVIDELSLGLAPTVVAELFDVVRAVNRSGTTVVIVEQSLNVALHVAERAVFLERGLVGHDGPAAELLERPDLLRSVFIDGGDRSLVGSPPAPPPAPADRDVQPVLACAALTRRFGGITAVDAVDLAVGPGEILGIIGHNGAGKTTLFDCLTGFLDLDEGRIGLGGMDITGVPPEHRAALGLGRSFQDPLLYPSLTVAQSVAVARERHVWCRSSLADALRLPACTESEMAVDEAVAWVVALLGLGPYAEHPTGALSTGTRRIVELACLLAQEPSVILLDEPSSGVAQAESEALGELLVEVRDRTGCAMVVIEHDMPLLAGLAHRLVALELGAVIAEGPPDEVLEHPLVVASYLGADEGAVARSGRVEGPSPTRRPRRRVPLRAG